MKTTQRHLPAITALLLISTLISFAPSSHAQSDPGLQTVAPGDVPADATFFLLSDYLINDSSLPAPYPFNPATNGVVYSLTSNSFIVDDTALADDADALDAMALLLQSQDQSSGNLFSGMTMMTMDSGLSGYSPMFGSSYTFDTNSLWLEITNVANNLAYLNLHNATDQVYAIWGTTDLLSSWNVQTEVWPTNSTVMPFTVPSLLPDNLFLLAEDWTGITENGNTTPDWWFWMYFGTTALYDTNVDSQGFNTLLYDYQNGQDPNIINSTVRLGNRHFNTTNATGSFLVMAGLPSYESVLVNSTNFGSATWAPYDGNINLNLGTTDGVYQIWMGLKGRASNSVPTWVGTSVFLDRTPPILTITNPAPGIVMQPYIQVQGLANERLSAVTYDISNALGVITNVAGTLTGEFLDTNLLAFTTNYFQCYDVQLTNGANLITVHATDWSGNTMSTNLSYTLDYSGKTNPPAIAMTWPQGGEDIAQNNITFYGTLSDPTAAVSLRVTDTNGDVNLLSGLVERDGHFWIQNVPLSPGTNWLNLTVQTVFGNTNLTATTNIIVTGNNSFGLTVNPVTSDLWELYSTVSGTVSDNNYTITVNGVTAINDGSTNWTAYDVPNSPGNMAVFQVNATNSEGDPQKQLTYIKPMEFTLIAATYYDDFMYPASSLYPHNSYAEAILTWTYKWDSGGSWFASGNTTYPGYSDWSKSYATITPGDQQFFHLVTVVQNGTTNTDSEAIPGSWWEAFPQEIGSLTVVNPTSPNNSWETKTADASWLFHVGSLGIEGSAPNLIQMTGFANEETPSPFGLGAIDSEGPVLPGPETDNTGQSEDAIYNAVSLMSAGTTIQSTVAAGYPLIMVYNRASSNALEIVDAYENDITDRTNDAVIVGQQIKAGCRLYLANQIMVTNYPLSGIQWTVPGYTISNYVVAPDSSSAMVVTNFPLNNSNVVFYWVDGASNRVLTCTVTINGKPVSAHTTFNVIAPTADFIGTINGSVGADANYVPGNGGLYLHFGGQRTNGGMINGIDCIATNVNLHGFNSANGYAFFTVQTLKGADLEIDLNGLTIATNVAGLDNQYPLYSLSEAGGDAPDTPGQELFGWEASESDSRNYTNYLMFVTSGSIPIPVKEIDWSWSGEAMTNSRGTFSLVQSNAAITVNNQYTGNFPSWTNVVLNLFR